MTKAEKQKRGIISEEKHLMPWGEVWSIGMGRVPRLSKEEPIILFAKAFGIGMRKKETADGEESTSDGGVTEIVTP